MGGVPVERSLTSEPIAAADGTYADLSALHGPAVHRLAVLLCGDGHVAEEITAEVFARVLVQWRRGRVDEPLPYLRRAVVNEVNSRFRRRRNERRAMERARRDDVTTDPARVELNAPLMHALAALPQRQRAVVVLRYFEDLSEADVARLLGVAGGTVKSHASQALKRLRELIEEEP